MKEETIIQLIEEWKKVGLGKDNQKKSEYLIQKLKFYIQNNKKKYKNLFDNMQEGFAHCEIICDKKGIPYNYWFLAVNTAFQIQTGLPVTDIVGKSVLEIFPDIEKSWIEIYGKVALTLEPYSFVEYNHNTNRYYETNAYSTKKGEFTILFRDISSRIELKEAYKKIEDSNKSKSQILANMPDGFAHCEIICDNKGIPYDYKILDVNAAYEKQTGIKAIDIVGKTVLEFYPDIEKSWIEIYGKVALSQKPYSFVDYNHNTNKYYDTNAYCPKHGQFILIFKDITEFENRRLQLIEATKKAEENDLLKSAFLANMSHEIRTPMNAILGCSNLLNDDTLEIEDKQKCLEHIKSSGQRLLTIISDIVDISKIDANQQNLIYKDYNLNKIIDDLLEQFTITNNNPAVILRSEKALKDSKSNIKTDELRLIQILSNIIENAHKYTSKGEIVFGYAVHKDVLQFHVKDSGIGISKEDQKIIFERFGQVKNGTTRITTGWGLGISIAKGLVELFEGEIWVESEEGKGASFCFTIPYIPAVSDKKDNKNGFTILVAEDEDPNFFLIQTWLKGLYTVIHAKNGKEAIEQFNQHPSIDLIVMDIKMPYMDGIAATIEIRKENKEIPIIASTAYVMNEESILIRKSGCNDILTKPIEKEEFLHMIAQYIN